MFQLILSGLALCCIYSLVALGYHITFMTSRTLNFAQGSAMMLGAVAALILIVDFGWPTPFAMLFAILLLGIFGLLLERPAALRVGRVRVNEHSCHESTPHEIAALRPSLAVILG